MSDAADARRRRSTRMTAANGAPHGHAPARPGQSRRLLMRITLSDLAGTVFGTILPAPRPRHVPPRAPAPRPARPGADRLLIAELTDVLARVTANPHRTHPGRPAVTYYHRPAELHELAVELLRRAHRRLNDAA